MKRYPENHQLTKAVQLKDFTNIGFSQVLSHFIACKSNISSLAFPIAQYDHTVVLYIERFTIRHRLCSKLTTQRNFFIKTDSIFDLQSTD